MILLTLLLSCTGPKDPAPATETASTTDSGTTPPTDSLPTDSTPTESTPTDTAPPGWDQDDDGDGYSERDGDCDDAHTGISPGVPEDCATWADDNCAELANEGCVGWAVWGLFLETTWTDAGDDLTVSIGSQMVGSYGTFVCRNELPLFGSPVESPPCPDCVWTFQTTATGETVQEGACEALVGSGDAGVSYPHGPYGFSYVNPLTAETSDIGWLLFYSDLEQTWRAMAGPGYTDPRVPEYRWYEFSHDSGSSRAYDYFRIYLYQYYYWRYGEPTRMYNP